MITYTGHKNHILRRKCNERKRLEFLIVDPQNDFCDPNGALYVPGAEEDSKRLAETIKRLRNKISHINVTLIHTVL